MPKSPKGELRAADVGARDIVAPKIGTPQLEEARLAAEREGKNAAAVALGRLGGEARAKGLTARERREIAKKAAKARWKR